MSEFKGTKQNWRLEQSLFYETDKVVLSDYRAICRISIEDEESKQKAAKNGETFVPMKDREIVALIAYLQRLGTDIKVKK